MGLHQKVTIIPANSVEATTSHKSTISRRLFDVKTAAAAFLIASTLASCGSSYESPETTKIKWEKEIADKKLELAEAVDEAKEDWEEAKKEQQEAEETAEKKAIKYEDAVKKLNEYLEKND